MRSQNHLHRSNSLKRLAILSFATLCPFGAADAQANRLPGVPDNSHRFRLEGQVHPLALTANDAGRVDSSTTLTNITLTFAPSADQQTALEALLARQQTPGSPDYHRWLTAEEYADRFGISQSDLDSIKSWLQSQGFTTTQIARSRTWISVSGTAAQVDTAFQTEMHRYQANGQMHFANSSAPSLPQAWSGLVRAVRGLNDFRPHALKRMLRDAKTSAALNPKYTSGRGNHYVAPDDLATIYNFAPLYNSGIDGSGQRIVIAGQTQITLSDIQHFRSEYGLAANDPQVILVPGSRDPGISSDDIDEGHLDLEWAGAVARNATLLYVYSWDVMTAVQYAIDQNLAPVISTSYGSCEPELSAGEAATMRGWAQQANAQGITWFSASGDTGAADCAYIGQGNLAVDIPASIPEVTGVGGTEFQEGSTSYWTAANSTAYGSATSYIPEVAWNDSAEDGEPSATGGGASRFFAKPSWQNVAGVPGDTARHVPDVAMSASADHDGYLVYSQGGDYVFGGTSVPTPIYAGLAALLNQKAVSQGQSTAGLGNINPALYALSQTSPSAFHDITAGDNIVTLNCVRSRNCVAETVGFTSGIGYDQATGLGSVDAYRLLTGWTGAAAIAAPSASLTLQSNIPTLTASDTVFVTATAATADSSTLSGTVTFTASGAQLGSASLSGSAGTATATLAVSGSKLAQGVSTITASWNGQTANLSVTVTANSAAEASPAISGVANAASFRAVYAPGEIVSVFGSQLAPDSEIASSVPLPLAMGGVAVTVNGVSAPLWYISATQLNIQIPYEVPAGSTAALVVNNNGRTASAAIPISAAAPGVFTDSNNVAISTGSAARGQTIALYITGAGAVSPAIATGQAPASDTAVADLPAPQQSVSVTVGGVAAQIAFAGNPVGAVGVVQINFQIPSSVAVGAQSVVVTVGNAASQAAALTVTP